MAAPAFPRSQVVPGGAYGSPCQPAIGQLLLGFEKQEGLHRQAAWSHHLISLLLVASDISLPGKLWVCICQAPCFHTEGPGCCIPPGSGTEMVSVTELPEKMLLCGDVGLVEELQSC